MVVYGPDVDYGGETYETVVIRTQTWFARNLNYDPGTGNSWCYDNEPSNCEIYGRLYDWETATEVCPDGWHLPSDEEWTTLKDYVGSSNVGIRLKSISGWYNEGGTDIYGFSALPGGYWDGSGFNFAGNGGYWWSSSEYNASYAYDRSMNYYDGSLNSFNNFKSFGFSVRCVQD
jgi:uncharacterized protein (TIGR02145 family)